MTHDQIEAMTPADHRRDEQRRGAAGGLAARPALSRDTTAVGDTVAIRLPAERLHLFDAQSGQRVA